MNKNVERLYNGLIKENPTFVLMLGMCPTLAVTSSAINGLGMGLSTTSGTGTFNMLISAFRKGDSDGVRMPAYIVIVTIAGNSGAVYHRRRIEPLRVMVCTSR